MTSLFYTAGKSSAAGNFKLAAVVISFAAASLASIAPAMAESLVTVEADRAKVVNIAGTPSAVIVGNPTFADVSIRSGQIIIHGRHFGNTNIIALDSDGNELANMEISVVRRRASSVVIYKAGLKNSYNCSPDCENALEVGDSPTYFEELVQKQINNKSVVAQTAAKLSD